MSYSNDSSVLSFSLNSPLSSCPLCAMPFSKDLIPESMLSYCQDMQLSPPYSLPCGDVCCTRCAQLTLYNKINLYEDIECPICDMNFQISITCSPRSTPRRQPRSLRASTEQITYL